jgi:hypothetical protein
MSTLTRLSCSALAAAALVVPAAAQQRASDDRTILIRGCVVPADKEHPNVNRSLLVWSDDNVMLTSVVTEMSASPGAPNGQPNAAVGTSGSKETIFYWLDDDVDDVAKHVGKAVEITGRMEREFKKGEMEIEHRDGFTEVKFEAHGKDVKARVPAGFLGEDARKDAEYAVTLRDVDVRNVRVLSESCSR